MRKIRIESEGEKIKPHLIGKGPQKEVRPKNF